MHYISNNNNSITRWDNSLSFYESEKVKLKEDDESNKEKLTVDTLAAGRIPEEELQSTNFKVLRQILEELVSEKTDINYTLQEFLLKACYKALAKQKEVTPEYLNTFMSIQSMLDFDVYSTSEFNNYFDYLFKDYSKSKKKSQLKLIAQVSQKWIKHPLCTILGRESQDTPVLACLRNMNKKYEDLHVLANLAKTSIEKNLSNLKISQDLIKYYDSALKTLNNKEYIREAKKICLLKLQYENILRNCLVINKVLRPTIGNSNMSLININAITNNYLFVTTKKLYQTYYKHVKKLYAFDRELVSHSQNLDQSIYEKGNKILQYKKVDHLKNPQSFLEKVNENKLFYENTIRNPYMVITDEEGNQITCDLGIDDSVQNLKAEKKEFFKMCDEYEVLSGIKSYSEIHEAMAELIFGNEYNPIKSVKTSSKQNKQDSTQSNSTKKQPIEVKNKALNIKTQPIKNFNEKPLKPYEKILISHAEWIHELSNKIKENLGLKRKEVLSTRNVEKAKIHSKELRDQIKYASLNFELFYKAIINQDLYAVGAIIPFLFLDQHLAIEQMAKHQIAIKGEEFTSHNLHELFEHCGLVSNAFIKDFSEAMLEARYPVTRSRKTQNNSISNPLRWILYSQELCQILNSEKGYKDAKINPADLMELCIFVYESYQKTLQCLLEQNGLDEDIHSAIDFKTLMIDLEKALEIEPGIFEDKVHVIKESRAKEKEKNKILNNRQNLMEVGFRNLKKANVNGIGEILLDEALGHLTTIDSVSYLQQKYPGVQFAALHHRNLLMFQWVYELIYRFHGHIAGCGELRWICEHDLEGLHAFAFSKEPIPEMLNEFNFLRNLHYTHEKGDAQTLQMVQELLDTLKILKLLDPSNPDFILEKGQKKRFLNLDAHKKTMKGNQVRILEKGIRLLQELIHLISSYS